MATIPDVGSITIVAPADESSGLSAGAVVSAAHGPVHHHIRGSVCLAADSAPPFAGSVITSYGYAQSVPTLAGPPIMVRQADPENFAGGAIAAHGVKEPDVPGSRSQVVREPQTPALFAGRAMERHGTKEPDAPARSAIVRGPEFPFDGWTWSARGFQEAVVWPGRPAIVRGPDTPQEGRVAHSWKYGDPWTPARPAIVRGPDASPLFAGSIDQSRVPELAPASPVPGTVARAADPTWEAGSAFVWRQILVQPGVPPLVRPIVAWVFDPPAYAGEVVRARGFAAAAGSSTPAATATAPYRLVAGQIFTPGAVAGQTGGQG